MEANPLIQAFRRLEPRAARKQALAALVGELTPYEWRHLQRLVNARTFYCDIIGSLPVELVAQVFSYLDIAASYRLQLVSRRWNRVLRVPDIVNQKLREWYGATPPHRASPGEDDYVFRQRQAEHIFRLCTGRPYSSLSVSIPWSHFGVVLVGDNIAWRTDSGRAVRIFNLRTGQTWRATSPARETIFEAAASDEIIALTGYKTCYVSTLSGDQSKHFRFMNAGWRSVACRGRTVACGSVPNGVAATIYIWDFDSSQGQSFDIKLTEYPFAKCRLGQDFRFALLPDPKTRTVAIFSADYTPGPAEEYICLSIYYSRFTFSGERVRDRKSSFPGFYSAQLGGFYPADCKGRFALRASCYRTGIAETLAINFEFDEETDQLMDPDAPLTRLNSCLPSGVSCSQLPSDVPCSQLPSGVSWWKDAYYQLVGNKEADPEAAVVCLGTRSMPTFRGPAVPRKSQKIRPFEQLARHDRDPRPWRKIVANAETWVSENFVVLAMFLGAGEEVLLEIHCFEKGLMLSGSALRALE